MEDCYSSSSSDLETITNDIITESFNMRKPLDYSEADTTETDEDHVNICNTYSPVTIGNAKDYKVYEETSGCLTSTYTQDLKLQHEDRFLFHLMTVTNLNTVRYQNPTHRFTSSIIVPPNKTIHDGMVRLIENTLAQHSDAFIITIFGRSYLTREEEYETIGDKLIPCNKNLDRGTDPVDLGYVLGNICSFSHQILVFNHYGSSEQYSYFLNNPVKRTIFFDSEGETLSDSNTDQYSKINEIEDLTQYTYSPLVLLRSIRNLLRRGYSKLIFHVKYENIQEHEDFKRFDLYFSRKGINVKYDPYYIRVN